MCAAASPEPEPKAGPLARLTAALPPKAELQKLLPLGMMFFCILFNYTILRNTKDVLVVTAAGAEIIPFLKTYVQLPGALVFTALYSRMSNDMSQEKIFYTLLAGFLGFFALFSTVLYPASAAISPVATCAWLGGVLPAGFAPILAIARHWTSSLFYMMAELWGSVVVSVLFWGLANRSMSVKEAKRYYPLFGLGANVALIASGQYVKWVSAMQARLPDGVDKWGASLKLLMAGVVASGSVIGLCFRHVEKNVLTDPECVDMTSLKKAKTKTKMTLGESAAYLAKSPYMRNLLMMVVGYGMAINIVEVTWKARLKLAFPDPNAYSAFMGNFASATGAVTLGMMLASRTIFDKFGWGVAAQITPLMLLGTGAVFFTQVLFPGAWAPVALACGTTPLMLAVVVGAAQNILSKSSKYSLFDPCKEMAYIPLDAEQKTKGKAAIDVIGNPLGKSGGSLIQQFLFVGLGSLSASTPYLGAILAVIVTGWLGAARRLSTQFDSAMAANEAAAAAPAAAPAATLSSAETEAVAADAIAAKLSSETSSVNNLNAAENSTDTPAGAR